MIHRIRAARPRAPWVRVARKTPPTCVFETPQPQARTHPSFLESRPGAENGVAAALASRCLEITCAGGADTHRGVPYGWCESSALPRRGDFAQRCQGSGERQRTDRHPALAQRDP
eukprot:gene25550-biopygen9040